MKGEFVIDHFTLGNDFHVVRIRAEQGGDQLDFDGVRKASISNNGPPLD